jgi:cytochrome bd-type quinol oxidase subunit 2
MFDYIDQIEPNTPTAGKFTTIGDFVAVAFNYALGIGIVMSVIGVLLSGIKYITAKSDPKAAEAAKNSLTWSIVAMLIVMGAFTIMTIITNALGVTQVRSPNYGNQIQIRSGEGGITY